MNKERFEKLSEALRQAKAVRRGEAAPSRVWRVTRGNNGQLHRRQLDAIWKKRWREGSEQTFLEKKFEPRHKEAPILKIADQIKSFQRAQNLRGAGRS